LNAGLKTGFKCRLKGRFKYRLKGRLNAGGKAGLLKVE
jgi:hypothetical protein